MRIDFVTVVWGDEFLDLFLNVCLPSQLTQNNLPALSREDISYIIYAYETDFERINNDASVKALLEHNIYFELRKIEFIPSTESVVEKYSCISSCHIDALKSTSEGERLFSWLVPDGFYPNGFFRSLWRLKDRQIGLIIAPSFRVQKDRFLSVLQEKLFEDEPYDETQFNSELQGSIAPKRVSRRLNEYDAQLIKYELLGRANLTTRQLVGLSVQSFHKITKSLFFGIIPSSDWPSSVLFQAPNGFVAKYFHIHPLVIALNNKDIAVHGTLDSFGFYESQNYNQKNILFEEDSDDDLWFVEISSDDHQLTDRVADKSLDLYRVTSWAEKHADNLQKSLLFEANFRFHFGDISEQWDEVMKEANDCAVGVQRIRTRQKEALEEISSLEHEYKEYRTSSNKELKKLRAERKVLRENKIDHVRKIEILNSSKNLEIEKKRMQTVELNTLKTVCDKIIDQVEKISEEKGALREELKTEKGKVGIQNKKIDLLIGKLKVKNEKIDFLKEKNRSVYSKLKKNFGKWNKAAK